MIGEAGGFAASLDADSEGEEGKFYVWSAAEIEDVLGAEDAAFFARVYGVTPTETSKATQFSIVSTRSACCPTIEEARLAGMRAKLLARRASRIRPGWDDKILADWNGLMIAALSRAAIVFERPEWLALAERAFACITTKLAAGETGSIHAYRAGLAKAPATASDYANMTWAALRLFAATGSETYLDASRALDRCPRPPLLGWRQRRLLHGRRRYERRRRSPEERRRRCRAECERHTTFEPRGLGRADRRQLATTTGRVTSSRPFPERSRDRPIGHCGLLAAELDLDRLVQVAVNVAGGLRTAIRN